MMFKNVSRCRGVGPRREKITAENVKRGVTYWIVRMRFGRVQRVSDDLISENIGDPTDPSPECGCELLSTCSV